VNRAFISDCEGPISKNDNAYEITSQFIPKGSRLYTVISRYDDALADVLMKPGYKAGYTLKLILPFLKAYNVTDHKMQEFSTTTLVLIPDANETLQHVRNIAHAFVVSTSYEHYIKALCQALDFPYENTYCTKVSIDKYDITQQEKNRLRKLAAEIAQMQVVQIPQNARSMQDFSNDDQKIIGRLDEIFWKEITSLAIGKIYSEVNPMGAGEKAEAIEDVVQRVGIRLSSVMYVGDSITDEEAFKIVSKGNGLTVSFNGNQYATKNAEIAVMSESSAPIAILADIFCKFGKHQACKLAEDWNAETLRKSKISPNLLERFLRFHEDKSCRVQTVTSENVENLAKKSNEFRKKVRGKAIGGLG
jgi:energy-converting hydrogenase A subunit R